MTDRCYRPEEIASLLDLAPEDPRQRHLASCPLCRARLAEYRAFMAEGPPVAGSRPEEAKRNLDDFVAGMIHGPDAGRRKGSAQSAPEGGFRNPFRSLRIPKLALAPGIAAAVAFAALILVVVFHPFPGGGRREAALRDLDDSTATEVNLIAAPVTVREGTITFTWDAVPYADRYEVQIFDADLDPIAAFDAAGAASLEIEADLIPPTAPPVWWRVAAYRDGDEFAHSILSALRLDDR